MPDNTVQLEEMEKSIQGIGKIIVKTMAPFLQVVEDINTAMVEFVEMLVESMKPVLDAFDNTILRTYIDQGAIYGETTEGMLRWYRETAEAERLEESARSIRSQHQMLADFKNKMQEKNCCTDLKN